MFFSHFHDFYWRRMKVWRCLLFGPFLLPWSLIGWDIIDQGSRIAFLAISRLTTSTRWPYYFTVHVYGVLLNYDSVLYFLLEWNLCRLSLLFVYICNDVGGQIIKKGKAGISWFNTTKFACLSQTRTFILIDISAVWSLFYYNDLRWETIISFIVGGGIIHSFKHTVVKIVMYLFPELQNCE